jgi:hypothetical protein
LENVFRDTKAGIESGATCTCRLSSKGVVYKCKEFVFEPRLGGMCTIFVKEEWGAGTMLSITELCISVEEGDWVCNILSCDDDFRAMEKRVSLVVR